jgi:hypothetical protein
MLSQCANVRVARLSIHGMMPAGEVLGPRSVLMVISCDAKMTRRDR